MWYKHATIYQIFVDRFAGMKRYDDYLPEFMGGNLKGIIDKIDYFKELGIDCLWLSPIYHTNAYHGYHIINFESIDTRYGNFCELAELIQLLHDNDIKIILDFVPNHCSVQHPFFVDAIHNKNSQYRDWFIFETWPDSYQAFLGYSEIPKINLKNNNAAEYMISVAKFWLALGIDGLRIDHAIGPAESFWKLFKKEIKKVFPEAFIFGEIWTDGLQRKFHKTTDIPDKSAYNINSVSQIKAQLAYAPYFDGTLDFILQQKLVKHFTKHNERTLKFDNSIYNHLEKYPPDYLPIGFLDNHDMNRINFMLKHDIQKLLTISECLFSLSIPVVLYYGTESGIRQRSNARSGKPHADINARQNMNWNSFETGLFENFREIIRKRKNLIK